MIKKAKPTITDVAKAAGVAVGTVSRVMNNHPEVNAGIRARVWQMARTLNYKRIRRRSERRGANGNGVRAGNIAAIIFGMEDTLVQLPVVNTALQGIEGSLSSHGRSLILANVPRGDRVPPFLLEDGGVDGLILKGPNQGLLPGEEESELLRRIYRLPHIWLMGRLPNGRGDHCNFDTESAGRMAAEHLHAQGHRRIAFFNPKPGQNQFEKLKVSFCATALRQGSEVSVLEVPPPERFEWPLPAITQEDKVANLAERWLRLPARTRPTALFIPSDRTSVQLYGVLGRHQVRIGKDISIVSCNNELSLLADLNPSLTTIDVHAEYTGRRTVDQLLWRIRHPDDPRVVQVLVEPTLVERGSVARL